MLKTKEQYDMMTQFEKEYKHWRLDKEPKDIWSKGHYYQHGELNNLFLAYQKGYALGKTV